MFKISSKITGVLYIIAGILLCVSPTKTLILYSLILGLVCLGFTAIIFLITLANKKNQPVRYKGFIPYILGSFLVMLLPLMTVTFVSWILILSVVLGSFYLLYRTINNKNQTSFLQFSLAIILIFFAIFMIFNPSSVSNLLIKIIGITLIFKGINRVLEAPKFYQHYDTNYKNNNYTNTDEVITITTIENPQTTTKTENNKGSSKPNAYQNKPIDF